MIEIVKILRNTRISTRTICTGRRDRTNVRFNEKTTWNGAVSEAEKVVGYSTSFLNLRWLLNDEMANVASHIKRLIGTNHPLLDTAKNLLRNYYELPAWGLVVLLVSKAAGFNSNFPDLECDKRAGILHAQRTMAEVTEIIKTSNLIHKSLITIDRNSLPLNPDLYFGNNLALLSGDYLLSTSFYETARLRNFHVQETISSTLRDLTEASFVGPRDTQNLPYPHAPLPVQNLDIEIPYKFDTEPLRFADVAGHMRAEWTLRNILGGASLLGKGCQCSMILAGHDRKLQKLAHSLGRDLALAWQASVERAAFEKGEPFSLISAPVMLHLEHDPGYYSQLFPCGDADERSVDDVDYTKLREAIQRGPALERTRDLQKQFAGRALSSLDGFEENDAKSALVNIINSM